MCTRRFKFRNKQSREAHKSTRKANCVLTFFLALIHSTCLKIQSCPSSWWVLARVLRHSAVSGNNESLKRRISWQTKERISVSYSSFRFLLLQQVRVCFYCKSCSYINLWIDRHHLPRIHHPFKISTDEHFYSLTGPTTLLKDKNGNWGPLTLYFGCRSSEHDDIYQHETSIAIKEGGLNHVYTAFSREPNVPKVY